MQAHLSLALAYLRDPRRVGAIAPASRALSVAMAREAWRAAVPVVLEVGGGTGAVTAELAAGLPTGGRLLVCERDTGFARRLSQRFPEAEVLHACASELHQLPLPPDQPVVLVSSLPLLSLPRGEAGRCIDAMLTLLQRHPRSRLVQYTYAAPHRRPFVELPPGWHWRRAASVWANLPPATVWVLESNPSPTRPPRH